MERIAEAVGVSNTPVREGLLSLRSEGFVELVPRRGFVVAEFTRQDVRLAPARSPAQLDRQDEEAASLALPG
jgi:DNA-binding GntR family transcriptional regulator